jgi:hypothetical protein
MTLNWRKKENPNKRIKSLQSEMQENETYLQHDFSFIH